MPSGYAAAEEFAQQLLKEEHVACVPGDGTFYLFPNVEAATAGAIRKHAAAYPEIISTSSVKGDGLDALRAEIAAFSSAP